MKLKVNQKVKLITSVWGYEQKIESNSIVTIEDIQVDEIGFYYKIKDQYSEIAYVRGNFIKTLDK